jgi:hypothetical protein
VGFCGGFTLAGFATGGFSSVAFKGSSKGGIIISNPFFMPPSTVNVAARAHSVMRFCGAGGGALLNGFSLTGTCSNRKCSISVLHPSPIISIEGDISESGLAITVISRNIVLNRVPMPDKRAAPTRDTAIPSQVTDPSELGYTVHLSRLNNSRASFSVNCGKDGRCGGFRLVILKTLYVALVWIAAAH